MSAVWAKETRKMWVVYSDIWSLLRRVKGSTAIQSEKRAAEEAYLHSPQSHEVDLGDALSENIKGPPYHDINFGDTSFSSVHIGGA
jgi:hypothetical protein